MFTNSTRTNLLDHTLQNIQSINTDSGREAGQRFKEFAIPQGSLGRLEELATFYASVRGIPEREIRHKVVFVMAGDHGVCEEGVSVAPSEITYQMLPAFVGGVAGIRAGDAVAYSQPAVPVDHPAVRAFCGTQLVAERC